MNTTVISVVFCTYNREKYIYNALSSVVKQNYPREKFEIVIVNNNSTDKTEELCYNFRDYNPDIHINYVTEKKQGLSYSRNRAIKESSGKLIVYVDDDATMRKDFLQAYDDFFENHPEAVAAGGPVLPFYETSEPKWMSLFTLNLITGYLYLGKDIRIFPRNKYPIGANICFRREIFDIIGGFNPDLGRKGNNLMGAEEKDLFARIFSNSYKVWYLPSAIVDHYISEDKLTEYHFKKLTYSIGISERLRTYNKKGQFIKRLFSEIIKWTATLVLFLFYTLRLQYSKGKKLIQFRYNVSRGLLCR